MRTEAQLSYFFLSPEIWPAKQLQPGLYRTESWQRSQVWIFTLTELDSDPGKSEDTYRYN